MTNMNNIANRLYRTLNIIIWHSAAIKSLTCNKNINNLVHNHRSVMSVSVTLPLPFLRKKIFLHACLRRTVGLFAYNFEVNISVVIKHFCTPTFKKQELDVHLNFWIWTWTCQLQSLHMITTWQFWNDLSTRNTNGKQQNKTDELGKSFI